MTDRLTFTHGRRYNSLLRTDQLAHRLLLLITRITSDIRTNKATFRHIPCFRKHVVRITVLLNSTWLCVARMWWIGLSTALRTLSKPLHARQARLVLRLMTAVSIPFWYLTSHSGHLILAINLRVSAILSTGDAQRRC